MYICRNKRMSGRCSRDLCSIFWAALALVACACSAMTAPTGMIAFFDAGSCPGGWSEVSTIHGRIPIAADNSEQVNNNFGGVALGDAEDRTHTHSFTITYSAATSGTRATGSAIGEFGISNPLNPDSFGPSASSTATSGYKFVQLRPCALSLVSTMYLPNGTVAYFAPSVTLCPTDWVQYTALSGRHAMPGYSTFVGTTQPAYAWTQGESSTSFTHNHPVSSTNTQPSDYLFGKGNDASAVLTLGYNGTSTTEATGLPFKYLLACTFHPSTTPELWPEGNPPPTGAMLFHESSCDTQMEEEMTSYSGCIVVPSNYATSTFGDATPPSAGTPKPSGPSHTHQSDLLTFFGKHTLCYDDPCAYCSCDNADLPIYTQKALLQSPASPVFIPYRAMPLCKRKMECSIDADCNATGLCDSVVCTDRLCRHTTRPSSFECRAAVAGCDVAEFCDGSSTACPADGKRPSGYVCRTSSGSCDPNEVCDGSTNDCPTDAKRPSTYVCRASVGACDADDKCDGSSNGCTADAKLSSGTLCRASAGDCDLEESCDGLSDACPADVKQSSSTVCRVSVGVCDAHEKCDGSSAACPADFKEPTSTVCRPSVGNCDVAEHCDGTSDACPPDQLRPITCTVSLTASQSMTSSAIPRETSSISDSHSTSQSLSVSISNSRSGTVTSSPSQSLSLSLSSSASRSPSRSSTDSRSLPFSTSLSVPDTPTDSRTASLTPTVSSSVPRTDSLTPSRSAMTKSAVQTETVSLSKIPSRTRIATKTVTATMSESCPALHLNPRTIVVDASAVVKGLTVQLDFAEPIGNSSVYRPVIYPRNVSMDSGLFEVKVSAVAKGTLANPLGFTVAMPPASGIRLGNNGSSAVVLSMPPIPAFEIDVGEVLQISFNPGWFARCRLTGPMGIGMIAVSAPSMPAVERAQAAAEILTQSAVAVSAAGVSASAAVDAQALAVMGLMSCAQPVVRKMVGNSRMLAPTRLSNGMDGIVLGNLVLMAGATVLFLVALVATKRYTSRKTWAEAAAFVRFPSLAYSLSVALHQGTSFAALQLVVNPSSGSDFGIGCFGILYSFAVPITFFFIARRYIVADFQRYTYTTDTKIPRFLLALMPVGGWIPVLIRRRFGSMFNRLQRKERAWLSLSFWPIIAMSLISAFRPESTTGCAVQYACMAAVQLLFAILIGVLHPDVSHIAHACQVVSSLSLSAAILGSALSATNPAGPGKDITVVAVQVQLSVTGLRIAFIMFLHMCDEKLQSLVKDRTTEFSWAPAVKATVQGHDDDSAPLDEPWLHSEGGDDAGDELKTLVLPIQLEVTEEDQPNVLSPPDDEQKGQEVQIAQAEPDALKQSEEPEQECEEPEPTRPHNDLDLLGLLDQPARGGESSSDSDEGGKAKKKKFHFKSAKLLFDDMEDILRGDTKTDHAAAAEDPFELADDILQKTSTMIPMPSALDALQSVVSAVASKPRVADLDDDDEDFLLGPKPKDAPRSIPFDDNPLDFASPVALAAFPVEGAQRSAAESETYAPAARAPPKLPSLKKRKTPQMSTRGGNPLGDGPPPAPPSVPKSSSRKKHTVSLDIDML